MGMKREVGELLVFSGIAWAALWTNASTNVFAIASGSRYGVLLMVPTTKGVLCVLREYRGPLSNNGQTY